MIHFDVKTTNVNVIGISIKKKRSSGFTCICLQASLGLSNMAETLTYRGNARGVKSASM